MNHVPVLSPTLPALIAGAGESVQRIFVQFFVAHIRNANTRRAYGRACDDFLTWCAEQGVTTLAGIQPLHVTAWVEALGCDHAVPTVKQRLAAVRHVFDWLVLSRSVPANPASSVRGPRYSVQRGKTPVLAPDEARHLLKTIPTDTVIGLRDRALIALMVYSFARIGAALAMQVRDVYVQDSLLWVRLHEKGGKEHEMPCHHILENYLNSYLNAAGINADARGPLFRSRDRQSQELSRRPLAQADAHAMIRRRAANAGIARPIGNHTLRATGIAAYLSNAGTLEHAAHMASHRSINTTQRYGERASKATKDEVEKILAPASPSLAPG